MEVSISQSSFDGIVVGGGRVGEAVLVGDPAAPELPPGMCAGLPALGRFRIGT